MSKKVRKTRKIKRDTKREHLTSRNPSRRLRAVIIVSVLCLTVIGGVVAQLGGFHRTGERLRFLVPPPTPSPNAFDAANPSKEYIYAGGRLVATEASAALPAAPTDLQLWGCGEWFVWTDNSTNETGFKIERSTDGVNFSVFTTVPANENWLWLNVGSAYIRVRATNTLGDSPPSNVVHPNPPCGGVHEGCNPGLCPEGTPTSPYTIWVDERVPDGGIEAGNEPWNWQNANPSPYSLSVSSQSAAVSGMHQHYFYGATQTLTVNSGEILIAQVYLDPANMPSEIMLQWSDGSGTWEHRAYWGANNIDLGTDGTNSRRYMGPLPASGQWMRLKVPASEVGLEGSVLHGLALTLFGGRASWDYIGKSTTNNNGGPLAPPAGLVAVGNPTPQVALSWAASPGQVDHYQIERTHHLSTGYTIIANVTGTTFNDTSVSGGTSYLYRVCAVGASGNHSIYANADLATTISFLDNPLVAGVTVVKAQHIYDLRQAVNSVRVLAGFSGAAWTDSSLPGVTIKAIHIQELRMNLDQALDALGLPAAPYTDSALTGVTIKKVHTEELRQRVN